MALTIAIDATPLIIAVLTDIIYLLIKYCRKVASCPYQGAMSLEERVLRWKVRRRAQTLASQRISFNHGPTPPAAQARAPMHHE